MPILKDFRLTKTIELPSYPGSQVEVYDSLLVGQVAGLNIKSDNELDQIISSLPLFIRSWNFTDEAGKDMEINKDNLSFLKMEDMTFLSEEILEFNKSIKKKAEPSQP